jgi:hypothetical protein
VSTGSVGSVRMEVCVCGGLVVVAREVDGAVVIVPDMVDSA